MSLDRRSEQRGSEAVPQVRGVSIQLEALLAQRQMTMTELSHRTGITMANLSILKNNKAKAIRMSTIESICRNLGVSPGELLVLD